MRKDTHCTRKKNQKTSRIFGRAIFERDIRGSWILSQVGDWGVRESGIVNMEHLGFVNVVK